MSITGVLWLVYQRYQLSENAIRAKLDRVVIANIQQFASKAFALQDQNGDNVYYVARSYWIQDVALLNPISVYATQRGLYIVLGEFLSEKSGVFIPRNEQKTYFTTSTDPSYEQISKNMYYFFIKS